MLSYFGRGNGDGLFPRKRFFDAAVKKIGDVSIFFSFRDAEIAEIKLGHYVGKNVLQRLGRNHDGERETLIIASHANVVEIFGSAIARDCGIEIAGAGEISSLLLV